MSEIEDKMQKTLDSTNRNLSTIRTGRATPDLLSRIQVDYYGSMVPLQQVASISVAEGNTLLVNVFDANAVTNVEKALMQSDLGITPNRDASVIRLNLPDLTEERRVELSKIVKKEGEEGKVALRNIRQDYLNALKKDDDVTEDDMKHYQSEAQDVIDKFNKLIDNSISAKETEILEV